MPRERLIRDIAVILTVKAAALCAIYFAFFSPASRAPLEPAAHIAGLPPISKSPAR